MADWRKVMFCDESTSRLVLRGYELVRKPSTVSKYDSRYIILNLNLRARVVLFMMCHHPTHLRMLI